jgi:hypothetical protein
MEQDHNIHGEVIGGELTNAIPESVMGGMGRFIEETPEGMTPVGEYTVKLEDGSTQKEQIDLEEILDVKPDETGKYKVFRSKIVENKKVIIPMVITGAALLAIYASRRYNKK